MPTYKPNTIIDSGADRRVRRKESSRLVSEAIEHTIKTEELSQHQRRWLAIAKPTLIRNFYHNFDTAKDLEHAELAKALLNYLSYIQYNINNKSSYPRPRNMRSETTLIKINRVCCSQYPGTYPLCNPKC